MITAIEIHNKQTRRADQPVKCPSIKRKKGYSYTIRGYYKQAEQRFIEGKDTLIQFEDQETAQITRAWFSQLRQVLNKAKIKFPHGPGEFFREDRIRIEKQFQRKAISIRYNPDQGGTPHFLVTPELLHEALTKKRRKR